MKTSTFIIVFWAILYISCNSRSNTYNGPNLLIDVDTNGLSINFMHVDKKTKIDSLNYFLGKADTVFSLKNTIYVYNRLGLKIYFNPSDSSLKSVELDYKKGEHKFSPLNTFSGLLTIFGTPIYFTTSPVELRQITSLEFEKSLFPIYYTARSQNLRIDFIYFKDQRTLDNIAVSFDL